MAGSDDFDEADLAELAKLEGKSVDEVRKELLRERLLRGKKARPREQEAEVVETAPSRAMTRPEARITRTRGNVVERDDDESAAEAAERWYEEESMMVDGVLGFGGQSAGGIFGTGPIATATYDPDAHARASSRLSHQATVRTLGLVAQLEQQLAGLLPAPRDPRQLPRRR